MREQLIRDFGVPVHIEMLGLLTVEAYCKEGMYLVFLVGDRLSSFLGACRSLSSCKQRIAALKGGIEADGLRLRAIEDVLVSRPAPVAY